jgi:hypothetical protein
MIPDSRPTKVGSLPSSSASGGPPSPSGQWPGDIHCSFAAGVSVRAGLPHHAYNVTHTTDVGQSGPALAVSILDSSTHFPARPNTRRYPEHERRASLILPAAKAQAIPMTASPLGFLPDRLATNAAIPKLVSRGGPDQHYPEFYSQQPWRAHHDECQATRSHRS